ncbi:hypothetical protein [Halochromatium glycolicum]|jgi:hypothetical protein|uniref:Uncharacterized protein n=1 Tax=Halochromatium glycolicum TaxID=85075 RepID=A0AAJ0XAU8_9GAMM|nr:hypothetical protein [Halochromatium glycolicum]MBK1705723.1 hypothetical protein [Halochromatium glycolicum]NBC49733.1 hypothetical protein [Gammaproteobacteria bacterium]
MSDTIENGTIAEVQGRRCVYYDGYWIKYYEPPPETLAAKKALIEALTRRLFNHVEHGINIPGIRLAEARAAYEAETNPERKRVNGAMLAGALFNRATTIFTKLVELQADGVEIEPDDALMRECGDYLLEALDLGHMVRHRGGDEGIDELWGEPFKAFSQPIAAFYESRYLKIAMTMREIDRITATITTTFEGSTQVSDLAPLLAELGESAKRKCEILRTDPAIFQVWPAFVVAGDRMRNIQPRVSPAPSPAEIHEAQEGARILKSSAALVCHMVRARTPMPKSCRELIDTCHRFRRTFIEPKLKQAQAGQDKG